MPVKKEDRPKRSEVVLQGNILMEFVWFIT